MQPAKRFLELRHNPREAYSAGHQLHRTLWTDVAPEAMGGEGHFAQPFFASPLAPGRAGRLRFFRPVAAQWTR